MGVVTRIDAEGRLSLPEEWRDEFPPEQEVELEHSPEGVLIRPLHRSALQAALRRKFRMNQPSHIDLSDLDMDAFTAGSPHQRAESGSRPASDTVGIRYR